MSQLYSVPVGGGRVTQVLPVPAIDATLDSTGNLLIFHDVKGYENEWRKHHVSAVTRDVWVYDFKANKSQNVTADWAAAGRTSAAPAATSTSPLPSPLF